LADVLIMTLISQDQAEVVGRARLHLQPIEGSLSTSVFEVEIDLHHHLDRLTLGDLEIAARRLAKDDCHEEAHRLWSTIETMAARHRFPALLTAANANAEGALRRAMGEERRSGARRNPKRYDYDELARAVDAGESRADVASLYGCALSTVARAVEYVTIRDELLDESPELFDQLMAGVNAAEIARRYDVSPKIIRWLVRTQFDRRGSD
jgi:hypothetical protein